MSKFLKDITPRTKILFVAFILVLLPGAIISYLSLQSIKEKAENLRIKYSGTVILVRDKLETEIARLQANLRNSVIEVPTESVRSADLKVWLRKVESENPAFKHLFLINADEGLISSSVSIGWKNSNSGSQLSNKKTEASFSMAEKSEFRSKNYYESITLYRKALATSASLQERSLLCSCIARCLFKLGNYRKAIDEYKKILELKNDETTIGNVPAPAIALSQISECYEALKADDDQYNTLVELYKYLLENPWDIESGEYLFYLNSVSGKIFKPEFSDIMIDSSGLKDLLIREDNIREQISFTKFINRNILPEVESVIAKEPASEQQIHNTSRGENNALLQLGFFQLPETFRQIKIIALVYEFRKEYILSDFLPEVLTSVELGRDLSVGILNGKDSSLYSQLKYPVKKYLVAANFSRLFPAWKVALFDPAGKSIEQLTGKERLLYLMLFIGIILVILIGIILIVRAVMHESEISRMKSEFVSNVSHELKTPLSLIRMFGETLDSGIVTDEKDKRKFYGIIRKESERLTHLINNVLDFSRMDAGVKEYNFQEADLVEVVRNSMEAYKFQINDSGFKIESELPDEPVTLKIDRDAISQVLLNLLNNAVKYSDEEKYILVRVLKNSAFAIISVSDHGIGIPKNELKKIFDKFYRVSNAGIIEPQGSGLGLTLAKHIVEAHGGSIEVESEAGRGSTFSVRIPLDGN